MNFLEQKNPLTRIVFFTVQCQLELLKVSKLYQKCLKKTNKNSNFI